MGDRVAVYSSKKRFKGTVTSDVITSAGLIQIKFDDGYLWDFFPQQCRRLIKKQRRRVWVAIAPSGQISAVLPGRNKPTTIPPCCYNSQEMAEWIEFIEVKK